MSHQNMLIESWKSSELGLWSTEEGKVRAAEIVDDLKRQSPGSGASLGRKKRKTGVEGEIVRKLPRSGSTSEVEEQLDPPMTLKDMALQLKKMRQRLEEVNTQVRQRLEEISTQVGQRLEEVNTQMGQRIERLELAASQNLSAQPSAAQQGQDALLMGPPLQPAQSSSVADAEVEATKNRKSHPPS